MRESTSHPTITAKAKIRAFDKEPFYAGREGLAGWDWADVRVASGARAFTIQPCFTFGALDRFYLVAVPSGAGNKVTVWSISRASPPALTIERTVTLSSWAKPIDAVQKGANTRIDTGDARLLGAVLRDNRIYACHQIKTGNYECACGIFSIVIGTFEKEIDVAVGQASSFYHRPAIQVAADGTVLVVFNASDANRYVEVRYMTRAAADNQFQESRLMKEGEAPYVHVFGGRNRWGDYNGAAVDPADQALVWFNGMYADSPRDTWGTWVGQTRQTPAPPARAAQHSGVGERSSSTPAGA